MLQTQRPVQMPQLPRVAGPRCCSWSDPERPDLEDEPADASLGFAAPGLDVARRTVTKGTQRQMAEGGLT